MQTFVSALFDLVQCFSGLFSLLYEPQFFLLLSSISLCGSIRVCLTIHSLKGFGLLLVVGYMNKALTNILVHICMDTGFHFLGRIPKSAIADLYGKYMFSFMRNCQIIFNYGCTSLRFHQQCLDSVSSHPCLYLMLLLFSILAILIVYEISLWF